MNIIDVQNPRFSNYEKTGVNLDVVFDWLGDSPVPFTAMPNDVEEHGRVLYAKAIAGEFGVIADFVPAVAQEATQEQPTSQGAQTL